MRSADACADMEAGNLTSRTPDEDAEGRKTQRRLSFGI